VSSTVGYCSADTSLAPGARVLIRSNICSWCQKDSWMGMRWARGWEGV